MGLIMVEVFDIFVVGFYFVDPELVFYFLILEAPDFSKSKYLLKSSDNMNVGAVSKLPRTEYTIFRDILSSWIWEKRFYC